MNIIECEMQQCLSKLNQWTKENEFKFSVTKAMHVMPVPSLHLKPQLHIRNNQIPYTENITFLGLVWGEKLLWKYHVSRVKAQCDKMNRMLKAITCQEWGANPWYVVKICRMYIRAKIKSGSPVYASPAKTTLEELSPIVTEALRTAIDGFNSTLRETIYVLDNEPPLNF